MAKNGAAALDFVEDLHEKTKPFFRKDIEELEAFVAEQTGNKDKRLNPWDVAYWSEKQRKAKYDFDEEETRPYFPIDGVLEGMFRLTEQVFGFKVEEKKSVFVEPGKGPLTWKFHVETTENLSLTWKSASLFWKTNSGSPPSSRPPPNFSPRSNYP